MKTEQDIVRNSIRRWIIFFIIALALSGITAFPIESELKWGFEHPNLIPAFMKSWLQEVYTAAQNTNRDYPFISYGSDWLAFAHLVIAIAFIGPYKDPVKNSWIIDWTIIACVAVIPLALIAGPIRQIPFYWRMIDCSFGLIGIIPLLIVRKKIRQLETPRPGQIV